MTLAELYKCGGILLEDVFDEIKKAVNKYKRKGKRFKIECRVCHIPYFFETEEFVYDAGGGVFHAEPVDWKEVKMFFLDCFESYTKTNPRNNSQAAIEWDVYLEKFNYPIKKTEYHFNIPTSYAFYMNRCCGDYRYDWILNMDPDSYDVYQYNGNTTESNDHPIVYTNGGWGFLGDDDDDD